MLCIGHRQTRNTSNISKCLYHLSYDRSTDSFFYPPEEEIICFGSCSSDAAGTIFGSTRLFQYRYFTPLSRRGRNTSAGFVAGRLQEGGRIQRQRAHRIGRAWQYAQTFRCSVQGKNIWKCNIKSTRAKISRGVSRTAKGKTNLYSGQTRRSKRDRRKFPQGINGFCCEMY